MFLGPAIKHDRGIQSVHDCSQWPTPDIDINTRPVSADDASQRGRNRSGKSQVSNSFGWLLMDFSKSDFEKKKKQKLVQYTPVTGLLQDAHEVQGGSTLNKKKQEQNNATIAGRKQSLVSKREIQTHCTSKT